MLEKHRFEDELILFCIFMPSKTKKSIFFHIFWNKSELKVKLTPTLMCTFTVVHDFGNQECVALDKQAGWTLEKKASGS